MRIIALLVALLALAGCANNDYYRSVDRANDGVAQAAIARAAADAKRYEALARIAESGDGPAKTAAVMALALSGAQGGGQAPQPVPPVQQQSEALKWASILLPAASQLGQGYYSYRTAINASDNARLLGISTNQTFGQMGAAIGSIAPSVTTTTTTTTNNSMADSYGVLGSGTYQVDSTHAPAVVNQPAPVIVTQPAPLIVTQPAPLIVTQPAPVIVTQPAPVVIGP